MLEKIKLNKIECHIEKKKMEGVGSKCAKWQKGTHKMHKMQKKVLLKSIQMRKDGCIPKSQLPPLFFFSLLIWHSILFHFTPPTNEQLRSQILESFHLWMYSCGCAHPNHYKKRDPS